MNGLRRWKGLTVYAAAVSTLVLVVQLVEHFR